MKKPTRLTKLTRVFTAADIMAFFNSMWGRQTTHSYAVRQIFLLPELTPPTWHIQYVAVYGDHIDYDTITVCQLAREDGTPYLNLPTTEELPEGLASPQAEDAAIAERKQQL